MRMTSVSGHLLTTEFDGRWRKWGGCEPVELFDATVVKICPQDYEAIKVSRSTMGAIVLVVT